MDGEKPPLSQVEELRKAGEGKKDVQEDEKRRRTSYISK